MIPTKCHLWQKQNLKWEDFKWKDIKKFWEYSHDWRYIIKCQECSQLYINDNMESVDWLGGNDKIYTTLVPVSKQELAEHDFSKLSHADLLKFRPVLLLSPDDKLTWIQ